MTEHGVSFRCTNQLALLTTDTPATGSYTRSVYVVADGDGVTLVEGLRFHLYVAVHAALDIHLLCEEMLLRYHSGAIKACDALRRDIAERRAVLAKLSSAEETVRQKLLENAVQEAKLVTLNNQAQLLHQYRRLLRGHSLDDDSGSDQDDDDDDARKPSREKWAWMQREMGGAATGFFVIKDYGAYEMARSASLRRSKLAHHSLYRFALDNHAALQYFVAEFSRRSHFEVGAYYDRESKTRVPGVRHEIFVLRDDSADPALYVAAKGDANQHTQYVSRQCLAFAQPEQVYKWVWRAEHVTALRVGCLEPAFLGSAGAVVGAGENIVARLNGEARPVVLDQCEYRPAPCTLTFSLADLPRDTVLRRVDLKDKSGVMSLVSIASTKRGARQAGLADDARPGEKKAALGTEGRPSAATPKMALLQSGQKKKQATLAFLVDKK
jgi:hypothetical protein